MSKDTSKKKDNVNLDKRHSTLKLFSIGSIVIMLVIVVFANILFNAILGKSLKFDFSLSGQNSVSENTQEYIDSLPADANIRIVGLFAEPSDLTGTPYQYITPLLYDMANKSSGRISVEYVDPAVYPSIINELDPTGVFDIKSAADSFVIQYNNRVAIVDPYDCFTYDPDYLQMGYRLPVSNIVEYTFVNSMYTLVSGTSAKAYFLTGVQETGSQQLMNILTSMGIESTELYASDDIVIPDDCDLLIVNGPDIDISEKTMVAMKDYLNKGGKMIVAVNFYSNVSITYKNLNSVLNEMNINVDSYVIRENNQSYVLDNTGFNSLIDVDSNYSSFASTAKLRCGYARPVREYDNPFSYIKVSPVLTTSDLATAIIVDEDGDMKQYENAAKYNIGMYSTYDGMAVPPEVFVFGTTTLTSDDYISNYGYNDANVEFIRSCVKQLLGVQSSNVMIESKNLDNYSIDSSKATSSVTSTMTIIFMVVIPLAMVIIATIVYNKRKNL